MLIVVGRGSLIYQTEIVVVVIKVVVIGKTLLEIDEVIVPIVVGRGSLIYQTEIVVVVVAVVLVGIFW